MAKKKASKKQREKSQKRILIGLTVASIVAASIFIWWWSATQIAVTDIPSGTTSSNTEVQKLIDEAHDAANSGTAQEALDAYNALAKAAEKVGDIEVQATAKDNASTYQSIVDAEKINPTANVTAETMMDDN